eukprot:GHVT01004910.1.p1 GENE.GHVT01004910.1~~GHVT01004910.1.p1  ORF type:complete len:298 (-),score=58.80 GHVT01004910.1:381-1274(-)
MSGSSLLAVRRRTTTETAKQEGGQEADSSLFTVRRWTPTETAKQEVGQEADSSLFTVRRWTPTETAKQEGGQEAQMEIAPPPRALPLTQLPLADAPAPEPECSCLAHLFLTSRSRPTKTNPSPSLAIHLSDSVTTIGRGRTNSVMLASNANRFMVSRQHCHIKQLPAKGLAALSAAPPAKRRRRGVKPSLLPTDTTASTSASTPAIQWVIVDGDADNSTGQKSLNGIYINGIRLTQTSPAGPPAKRPQNSANQKPQAVLKHGDVVCFAQPPTALVKKLNRNFVIKKKKLKQNQKPVI